MSKDMVISLNKKQTSKKAYDPYLWGGFSLISVIILAVASWVTFAPIQGAIIAPGTIIVDGDTKIIQHQTGGTVSEINVQVGDVVTAGDVLVKLDSTVLDANLEIVSKRLNEALASRARLEAERDNRSSVVWNRVFPLEARTAALDIIMSDQSRLFHTRRRARLGQIDQLGKRINQSEEQVVGFQAQIESNIRQSGLIEDELVGLRQLRKDGLVSQNRILNLEREKESLEGRAAGLTSEIARTRTVIAETEIEILQVSRNAQESVITELRSVQSTISDLEQQSISADDQASRVSLRAPVSGRVHNLQISTIGGVISPAQPIMEIIPDNVELIIESRIMPTAIDQVYYGQKSTVRFLAFNQRTTPELLGHVKSVSGDTLSDPNTGAPYYSVRIEVDGAEIARLGDVAIVPGMPVEAFMQTDKRSPLDYLLQPLTDQLSRAFREE